MWFEPTPHGMRAITDDEIVARAEQIKAHHASQGEAGHETTPPRYSLARCLPIFIPLAPILTPSTPVEVATMPTVTVVPTDSLIIVDGKVLVFPFDAPTNLHALQWRGDTGHTEWTDCPNKPLTAGDYDKQVAPYVALWEEEKRRLETEAAAAEEVYNSLENVKARKLATIDAETSSAIMAGFTCEATPPDTNTLELLHFSYDEFDQQNFADAAVSMQIATASDGGIPTTTPWNAYRNHTADSKGDLVILQLTAETFLPIYAAALNHKATKMAEGGQRKAAVATAQTVEDVEAI